VFQQAVTHIRKLAKFVLFYLRGGDAENARHENAGLENAAQTCRLLQGVENARLENMAQKYRAGKCRNG